MILSFECTFLRPPQLSLMLCLFVPSELQSFGFYSNHLGKNTHYSLHNLHFLFYQLTLCEDKVHLPQSKPRTLKTSLSSMASSSSVPESFIQDTAEGTSTQATPAYEIKGRTLALEEWDLTVQVESPVDFTSLTYHGCNIKEYYES